MQANHDRAIVIRMPERVETFDIEHCILCSQKHTFPVIVDYSPVVRMMTLESMSPERPAIKRYTRVFTCPILREQFQGTVSIISYGSEIIHGVKVGAVHAEKE
jgi:hypothetical protein